jgi:outer membrane protein assembly factor BamB
MRLLPKLLVVFIASYSAMVDSQANAEDWPHWMGKNRDNVWNPAKPVNATLGKLKSKWETPIAGGYSGPAVVGDRLYITDLVTSADAKVDNFGRRPFDGTERVLCLNSNTGEVIWKKEYPVNYAISYPAGPRCTPIVDEGSVYTLGAEGDLFCFEASSGKVVWSKKLKEAYKTNSALWGFAAHPLIDGNKLITLAGGPGSHTVALDKKTGNEIWRFGTAPEQGYSPPSIINAGGVRQLILPNPVAINSVDPETGKLYWTLPYDASNGSIIMTPLHVGKYLYVGGYSDKNLLIELDSKSPKAKQVWRNESKKGISPVNVQPIAIGDVVYGMDQSGEMISFKVDTGERLWETSRPVGDRKEGSGSAFIVRNGDVFFLFNERGELVVAKMNPKGYEEISRQKIIEPTNNAFGRPVVWCAPAFANGNVYVRNDEKIICVPLN